MRHAIAAAALAGALVSAAAYAAPTPAAQVRGPVRVTVATGEVYRGSNEQPVAGPGAPMPELDRYGYMQEEYVVSGTVEGKPYATTLLVRKPRDPAKFSGLVGVETIHAAGAIPFWGTGREVWAPNGHAWVAVASQRVALEDRVKAFNPKRYGPLNLTIPQATASAPGAAPGQAAGGQDLISQAIVAQVGVMLKSNLRNGPLRGMRVRHLLLGGASQTGGTTLRYIQQSHATARMADGGPIYDGYFPSLSFPATPVSTADVPIVHITAEGDLASALAQKRPLSHREDSDAATDRYRSYQVAGGSHVPTRGQPRNAESGLVPSQFPSAPVSKMALLHLIDWVTKGLTPPKAQRIEVANGQIVRDEHGNARGGVRTAYLDVPSARIAPNIGAKGEANSQQGTQDPIFAPRLKIMYGSREEYLKRFDAAIDKSVAERWITQADGAKLKAEEAANPPAF